jgi:hypothetical protein
MHRQRSQEKKKESDAIDLFFWVGRSDVDCGREATTDEVLPTLEIQQQKKERIHQMLDPFSHTLACCGTHLRIPTRVEAYIDLRNSSFISCNGPSFMPLAVLLREQQ